MNWYYVENGQQRGPVTEEDFAALAARGVITAETLVWREGLEKWLPYLTVKPAAAAAPTAAPPGQVICCECGRAFAPDDVVRHGDVYVCGACKPIFLQKLREGVAAPGGLIYAGFWIRVGAKLLDALIIGVPFFVIVMVLVFAFIVPNVARNPATAQQLSGPANPVVGQFLGLMIDGGAFLINFCYNVFFLGKFGATPGKMAAGLRVVNADGSRISFGMAAARVLAEILSGLICYFGYFMVGWDNQKRALHDRICNTRVIHK